MTDIERAGSPRIYLAGPDVFLPDAKAIGEAKCAICRDHGLEGVVPAEGMLDLAGLSKTEQVRKIALANEALMRGSDAAIANMTPFRGASMDAGTAYEMGFMRALGRPVFAYTNAPGNYAPRAREIRALGLPAGDFDAEEVNIEAFDLADNLMMVVAVLESGGDVHGNDERRDVRRDLAGFRLAVRQAARLLGTRTGAAP